MSFVSGRTRLETFFLANPNLDTDLAGSRVGFSKSIIDVRTQSVKRNLAFPGPLDASDFCAVDTTGSMDLDSIYAHIHRDLLRSLHRTLEGDTTFELKRNAFGYELCIRIGSLNFAYIEIDFLLRYLLELGANRIGVSTLAADDNTRTRGEERNSNAVHVALDENLRNTRFGKILLADFANLLVLYEQCAECALRCEPTAAPGVIHANAETYWVNFLSHIISPP